MCNVFKMETESMSVTKITPSPRELSFESSGSNNLKKDKIVHIREMTFSCSDCEKSFYSTSSLSEEEGVHSGERQYRCDDCTICFRKKTRLMKPKGIHTGQKIFSCGECGKCFHNSSNLSRHKRKIHRNEKPFSCKDCGLQFSNKSMLLSHQEVHALESCSPRRDDMGQFSPNDDLFRQQSTLESEEILLADHCSNSDIPQWQKNENKPILNYVGICPHESFEDLPVKEEIFPFEDFIKEEVDPLKDLIKEEVDPLAESSMNIEVGPSGELPVKEEIFSSEVIVKEEIDPLKELSGREKWVECRLGGSTHNPFYHAALPNSSPLTRPPHDFDLATRSFTLSSTLLPVRLSAPAHPSHVKFEAANPVTLRDLSSLCDDEDELRLFLMKSGLLGDYSGVCEQCKEGNVTLQKHKEGYTWRCCLKKCRKCISIRNGSFFTRSHLGFNTILFLVYGWIHELPQKFMQMTLRIGSRHTLIDWHDFCREVCVDILMKDNRKIGGSGRFVEIDESKFTKKKHHKGQRVEGCWVLGGIDRETKDTFFKVVPDGSAETLLPILIENIHPESIVISDCWKSYQKLSQHYKEHLDINHSLHFVDPEDKRILTNNIESTWRILKRKVSPRCGTVKALYDTYFSMYCIKRRYLSNVDCPYKTFLELIKRNYPLKKFCSTPRKRNTPDTNMPKTNNIGIQTERSQRHAATQTEDQISADPLKRIRITLPSWSDGSDYA